jgi:hypothetical protein
MWSLGATSPQKAKAHLGAKGFLTMGFVTRLKFCSGKKGQKYLLSTFQVLRCNI